MNFVEPIRSKEKIELMKNELAKSSERDRLLFVFGINVGLRISDIIELTVRDMLNLYGLMNTHIELKEKKTNKFKRFKINENLAEEIFRYIKNMNMDDYIFKSRTGIKHITRIQAYRILNQAAKRIGLEENIGTHTLRKTFGYHFYLQTHDIATLMELFNHSSPSITLRYIGITQDTLDNALDTFNL